MMSNDKFKFRRIPPAGKATTADGRKAEAEYFSYLNSNLFDGFTVLFRDMETAIDKFKEHAMETTKNWKGLFADLKTLGISLIDLLLPNAAKVVKKIVHNVILHKLIDQTFDSTKDLVTKKIKANPEDFPKMIETINQRLKLQIRETEMKLRLFTGGGLRSYAAFIKIEDPYTYQSLWFTYNNKDLGESWEQVFRSELKNAGYPTADRSYIKGLLESLLRDLEFFRLKNGFNINYVDIAKGGPRQAEAYGVKWAKILAPGAILQK